MLERQAHPQATPYYSQVINQQQSDHRRHVLLLANIIPAGNSVPECCYLYAQRMAQAPRDF